VVRVKRRPSLFNGYWWTLEGQKIRRASRADIAEAYRLWAKHADIRALSANTPRMSHLPRDHRHLASFAGASSDALRPRRFQPQQEALW
jgi:hypothetical protein